jgi:hypothetical protein
MSAPLGYELETTAAGKLLAAIVEQAVSDLRRLQAAGVIVGGKIVKGTAKQLPMARELIHFFEPGGTAEKTLTLLKVETNFTSVRKALNLVN